MGSTLQISVVLSPCEAPSSVRGGLSSLKSELCLSTQRGQQTPLGLLLPELQTEHCFWHKLGATVELTLFLPLLWGYSVCCLLANA